MAWDRCCVTVSLASPTAVELSMRVGVGGWGWPSSLSVVWSGVEWGHFFGVVEKSPKLGFSSRGEDHFHDGSEIEDGTIEDGTIEDVGICLFPR